jgi:hypothetical protein
MRFLAHLFTCRRSSDNRFRHLSGVEALPLFDVIFFLRSSQGTATWFKGQDHDSHACVVGIAASIDA